MENTFNASADDAMERCLQALNLACESPARRVTCNEVFYFTNGTQDTAATTVTESSDWYDFWTDQIPESGFGITALLGVILLVLVTVNAVMLLDIPRHRLSRRRQHLENHGVGVGVELNQII